VDESYLYRKEGFRAYIKGKGTRKNANPYAEGTPEHQQFDLGWREAKAFCSVKPKTPEQQAPTRTIN